MSQAVSPLLRSVAAHLAVGLALRFMPDLLALAEEEELSFDSGSNNKSANSKTALCILY